MTNFQAVLTSTKFDIDCRNVLRFDNREAQEEYFNVASLFSNAVSINFNAGSLIETTIIFRMPENAALNDLMSSNYCIIKDNSANATLKYYYYFVKNIIQDSGNQLKVWLELDVFQTYYIDIEFSDCQILKGHLNRFIDNGDGSVSFNSNIDSELFEREDIQDVPKRLIKRTLLKMGEPSTSPIPNSELIEWLHNNVIAYVYVYIDPLHQYKVFNKSFNQVEYQFSPLGIGTRYATSTKNIGDNDQIPANISCVCFPILKEGKKIYIKGVEWTALSFKHFIKYNNDYSYIYKIKLSLLPPFSLNENNGFSILEDPNVPITENSVQLYATEDLGEETAPYYRIDDACLCVGTQLKGVSPITDPNTYIITVLKQRNEILSLPYTVSSEMKFEKTEIIQSNRDPKFNPKLLASDYTSIVLRAQTGESFEYDLQKIGKTTFQIKYCEPLSPDITRGYASIYNLDGVYIEECQYNFTGLVYQIDTSLTMITSAYQSMLAENKNFYLQNSVNRATDLFKGITGAGINMATHNVGGAVGSLVGSIGNFATSKIKQNLTVDNMKHAPSSATLAGASGYLMAMVDSLGIYIEEYSILPNEKQIINDYMCQYGFTVNKIGNIKEYDNIRIYYNYVQAEIQETSGINISKAVHDKFKEIFARGVRFWNVDNFSYEKENYERWLENE